MMPPRMLELVQDYLRVRRGMGFKLDSYEPLLVDFASYTDETGHRGPITVDLALRWAQSRSQDHAHLARRLAVLRGFARHRSVFDPDTEIPPVDLVVGASARRRQPHIYSEEEIAALLDEVRRPERGLRPNTYVTFFSLLASTGLRLSEACRLECDDVNLTDGVLSVRETKFRKSRLVPLHATTAQALADYAAERDTHRDVPRRGGFFRTERCAWMKPDTIDRTFSRLRQRLGWTAQGRARRPTIHDFRHTFAVRCLLRWHAQGIDIDRKMLALSTYLGHAKISDTYWYLTAVPELMAIAGERFEGFVHAQQEVGI